MTATRLGYYDLTQNSGPHYLDLCYKHRRPDPSHPEITIIFRRNKTSMSIYPSLKFQGSSTPTSLPSTEITPTHLEQLNDLRNNENIALNLNFTSNDPIAPALIHAHELLVQSTNLHAVFDLLELDRPQPLFSVTRDPVEGMITTIPLPVPLLPVFEFFGARLIGRCVEHRRVLSLIDNNINRLMRKRDLLTEGFSLTE